MNPAYKRRRTDRKPPVFVPTHKEPGHIVMTSRGFVAVGEERRG